MGVKQSFENNPTCRSSLSYGIEITEMEQQDALIQLGILSKTICFVRPWKVQLYHIFYMLL